MEFVWDQIRANSPSASNNSSPPRGNAGAEGPMKVLTPMSQEDEADQEHVRRLVGGTDDEEDAEKRSKRWKSSVESTLVKMTAEIAALREQISSGREWRDRRRRSIYAWLSWLLFLGIRQFCVDALVLALVLLWMRKRRDRRLEDLVGEYIRAGRSLVRRYLPSR